MDRGDPDSADCGCAGRFSGPVGERAGDHAGRGPAQHKPDQPVWPKGGQSRPDLRFSGDSLPAAGGGLDPSPGHTKVSVHPGEVSAGAGGGGWAICQYGQGQQPPSERVCRRLHFRRRGLHFCGDAL